MADVVPGSRLPTDNPYWEGIQLLSKRGFVDIDEFLKILKVHSGHRQDMRDLMARYGRVIPEPGLLAWVGSRVGTGVVEVDTETAYWGYLFEQMGKRVWAYGRHPPERKFREVYPLGQHRNVLSGHETESLLFVLPRRPRPVLPRRSKSNEALDNVAVALKAYGGPNCVIITDVNPQANERLAQTFNSAGWRMRETYQGICTPDELYTAYWYQRPSIARGWAVQPTQPMPVVKPREEER